MRKIKKALTYLVIVAIAAVCALNYKLFVFPNKFAPAGLNGICTMIQYVFHISMGYLSLLINIPLALLVYCKVSKPLAVRSMLYVVTFSVLLLVLERVDVSQFAYETENGTSTILGPLAAGIIAGTCNTILIRASAYTGGTDFIASLIHKYHPEMNFFWTLFGLNVVVAGAAFFVYDFQVEPVLLCILYCFTSSTVSDRLVKSGRTAIRFEIITQHPEQISSAIISRLHHSATLVPAKGMYLGKPTNILICVVNKSQLAVLSSIIREYPNTFAVLSQVNEVVGNFKRVDNRGNIEKVFLDQGDGNAV